MLFFQFPVRRTEIPEEGQLQFIEAERHVPFPIRRIYYSTGVKTGFIRGQHAHLSLQQVLVCVFGKIQLDLDSGMTKETVVLEDPSVGVYVGPLMWRSMTWLQDESVLLVMASSFYDEKDYIRSYEEFIQIVAEKERG